VRRSAQIKVRRFWHAHRWHLLAAVVVVPVLAAAVNSAVAGTDPRARSAVCKAARQAADEFAAHAPETSRESLDALKKDACSRDPVMAPSGKASPVAGTPGCHMPSDADRRSPGPRRAAEPARPIPFFAARSGRLPATGTPRVGGIQLPAGSRCGPFWSTDAGVPDSFELARKLAAVFPSTGLWPVLWSEEPDPYINGGGEPGRVDSLDAEVILRRAWKGHDAERRPFPGLAAAEPAAKQRAVEPFGNILESSLEEQPPGGPILMLVPVNRPADILAVLAPQNTVYFSDNELTAVLRSWEERFGAVVTALSAGGVDLAVGAPPRDDEQLNRVVAEHRTFTPDLWTAADLQKLLRSSRTTRGITSAHYWALAWPD
jgi:hypothetical protein